VFVNSRDDAAEILASGAIGFYELTGELNDSNFSIEVVDENGKAPKKEKLVIKKEKFFNVATDAYLYGHSGRKKNTSERIGNFISGSKGDISRTSFSIFDGNSGGLTWNFVDVEENTNVYNMEKTLDKFAKKFMKKLPYEK